ncbi:MAG: GntR family transcriptional regulator [Proteobacteria bacterium]|nr:GntR family transcriptional regulator [Pseudomonadota bacterium]
METAGLALEERAYRRLRQALMEGAFAPGDRLSIRRVAAALHTSPMPARTALRRLAAEQAVDVLPSGTAVVPRLTRKSFIELSIMRAELEPLALRMAVPNLTRSVFRTLERLIRDHKQARANSDPAASQYCDREFLFTLYRLADAPMLLGFVETMWLRRGPLFWEVRWALFGHAAANDRHQEILDALKAGRLETAASALRQEIESARDFVLTQAHFAGEPAGPSGLAGLAPLKPIVRETDAART